MRRCRRPVQDPVRRHSGHPCREGVRDDVRLSSTSEEVHLRERGAADRAGHVEPDRAHPHTLLLGEATPVPGRTRAAGRERARAGGTHEHVLLRTPVVFVELDLTDGGVSDANRTRFLFEDNEEGELRGVDAAVGAE